MLFGGGQNIIRIISIFILISLISISFAASNGESKDHPIVLGAPYEINCNYTTDIITIDGILSEPAWNDSNTTITKTNETFNGWNLTIYVFHDLTSLYVGVEVTGDNAANPNDFCALCFDVDHDGVTPPEDTDMMITANNTAGVNMFSLSYGDGIGGWTLYSNEIDFPNSWPAGFETNASMQDNATYEFKVPISAAWGEVAPLDGNITGFEVHGFGQSANENVWWPDEYVKDIKPNPDYCNLPDQYGDLIFNASGDPPDHLEYVSGDEQSAAVDTAIAQPMQVRVVNATGGNVSGLLVNYTIYDWPASATGYYFEESGLPWHNSISNSSGIANATLHLGTEPGNYWVNASNSGLAGIGGPTFINTLNATATAGALALASIEISANPMTVQVTGSSTLSIWANDSGGGGIAGLIIDMIFDASPSNPGTMVTTPASDMGGGYYTATYTAGQKAWVTDVIRASCSGIWGTEDIIVESDVPDNLFYISGDNQQKNVNLVLDAPFIVGVEDQYGNAVPGTQIDWVVNGTPVGATGQILSIASNNTNADGESGSLLTLGNIGGWYFTNATSPALVGQVVNFTAEALELPIPADLNLTKISGDSQSFTANATLPLPLIVEVQDNGSPAGAGIPVWFNITAGGGTLDNPSVTTDADGRSQVYLTLGTAAGLNSVTAEISSSGISQVTFVALGNLPELSAGLASNVTSVVAGQSFAYIVSYDNAGTEAAGDVWLNNTKPGQISYVVDSSGITPTISGTNYSWHFTDVAPGAHSFVIMCSLSSSAQASISNSFTIDYTDQLDRPLPQELSNTVTIQVLSEAVINIPPSIDGVPDLVVRYDWDYRIELAPYISDPDDELTDLMLILSDTIHVRVDATNNLAIILNYSEAFLDTTQTLNITVSDGYGSDWEIISIKITDDFPPEIVQAMPDVTLNEDTISYPFNITEYFFDRDGDALYYTYGQTYIDITILWNNTVRVEPDPNWFGEELVTFRASDPTGALIEDTIKIIVLPINDPPVVLELPDQEGVVDITWVMDLSAYVSDIDDLLENLVITTDSDYVTVNGLNLTFRCISPIESDIITVTVSDGEAQVYGQINVIVIEPGQASTDLPTWVPPLIIIIIILALLLAIVLARKKPIVEQAFLIYKDGAMLAHATNRMIPEMDTEIFSSMLMAIQDFVKDSFKDEKNWELNKLEFGDSNIYIGRHPESSMNLALVYKGNDKKLPDMAKKTIESLEKEFGDKLKDWDGNLDDLRGSRDIMSKSLFKK